MTRMRTSKIWIISREEMQQLLDESKSFVEVLEKLSLGKYSGNHRTLKERIKLDNLSLSKINENRATEIKNKNLRKKKPLSEIMVEDSNYKTNHLKKRLIAEKIIEYFCEGCGNDGKWKNKKLVLQLEHKNGKSRDHRLENLCLLCPNCHSQTDTYSGRNNKNNINGKACIECGASISKYSTRCRKCLAKNSKKKLVITKEELEKLVKELPMAAIGRQYGVSCNCVRKRCRAYGISWRSSL